MKDIRSEIAKALREAADAYQMGGWAAIPQADCDISSKRRQAEHAVAWLRKRAEQYENHDDHDEDCSV